jgi:biopolymer transport protein ExbB
MTLPIYRRLPAFALVSLLALAAWAHAEEAPQPAPPPAATAPAPAAAPAPAGPPAVAPVAPPPLTPPTAQTEEVENPYGLAQLWRQGDYVARGTIVILLIMSMGTWYVLVLKLIEQARLGAQAREAEKKFWSAGSVEESIARLKRGSAFRFIADAGVSAMRHHEGTLVENIDLHSWISMSIQRSVDAIANRLQRGLAFLATVGSTAPFVGLFGTVWGIYHALIAIGLAGQASIDKVAGPVGEALIMTAIGLAVAVPAVLGYNWLVRRNKAVIDRVRAFGADLHAVLIGGTGTRAPVRTAIERVS